MPQGYCMFHHSLEHRKTMESELTVKRDRFSTRFKQTSYIILRRIRDTLSVPKYKSFWHFNLNCQNILYLETEVDIKTTIQRPISVFVTKEMTCMQKRSSSNSILSGVSRCISRSICSYFFQKRNHWYY